MHSDDQVEQIRLQRFDAAVLGSIGAAVCMCVMYEQRHGWRRGAHLQEVPHEHIEEVSVQLPWQEHTH